MEQKHLSLIFILILQLTVRFTLLNAFDEEELVKITPGAPLEDEEKPLSSAEQYVDFLANGGKVSDNEMDADADYGDDQAQKDEYDYESETMDFLLKHYFSQFQDLSSHNGKKKLEEHIEEMDFDSDGVVSKDELSKWLIAQAEKGATEEAMNLAGVESFDLDKDGKLNWDEVYEDLKKLGNAENENFKKGIEMEKIRFSAADKNKDNLLDDLEYTRYATPEYFTEMANYTIQSYISDFDQNRDLKISKQEFLRGFDENGDKEGYDIESKKFDKMDKNKDGFLSLDEVANIALEFTIKTFVDKRVKNIFFHADADENGKLSKLEIITSYPVFTKGLPEEDVEVENKHDEL